MPPVLINQAVALRAIRAYNGGSYRRRLNVSVDGDGYRRFAGGVARDIKGLSEQLRFTADEYGGVQARLLPHPIGDEARIIAKQMLPEISQYTSIVRSIRALADEVPSTGALEYLFAPFDAAKRWTVWASKTLHFLKPASFPVLDSRAKRALGAA